MTSLNLGSIVGGEALTAPADEERSWELIIRRLVFGFGIRHSWDQIPAHLLISCVDLDKSLHLSEPLFLYL